MRANSTYRAHRRNEIRIASKVVGASMRAFWDLLPLRELKMKHSKAKIAIKMLSADANARHL